MCLHNKSNAREVTQWSLNAFASSFEKKESNDWTTTERTSPALKDTKGIKVQNLSKNNSKCRDRCREQEQCPKNARRACRKFETTRTGMETQEYISSRQVLRRKLFCPAIIVIVVSWVTNWKTIIDDWFLWHPEAIHVFSNGSLLQKQDFFKWKSLLLSLKTSMACITNNCSVCGSLKYYL